MLAMASAMRRIVLSRGKSPRVIVSEAELKGNGAARPVGGVWGAAPGRNDAVGASELSLATGTRGSISGKRESAARPVQGMGEGQVTWPQGRQETPDHWCPEQPGGFRVAPSLTISGSISLDRSRWITKRPDFFLPVRVLSKLFRTLMIEKLIAAHAAGELAFYAAHAALVDATAFAAYLAPLKRKRWFFYAKRPFAGPKAVLAYLSRYTHRVAISNRRLIAADANAVTFKIKDYRIEGHGRYKTMTLDPHEFIRRFLSTSCPRAFIASATTVCWRVA